MHAYVTVLATILLATHATSACAIELGSCGQSVPARERATLTADLLCDGGLAVELGPRSTLDLAGFSIVNTDPLAGSLGVRCPEHACAIVGPGEGHPMNDPTTEG